MTAVIERPRSGQHGGRPARAVSEQISRRVLDAAADLFLLDGAERTSMDAVAARAGISKRTLYSRFPTKANLLEAVVVDALQPDLSLLEQDLPQDGSLGDQLLACAERLVAIALNPNVVGLERTAPMDARQFPELISKLRHRFRNQILEIICEVMRRFEPMSRRDEELLRKDAEIFASMVILPSLRKAIMLPNEPSFDANDHLLLKRAVEIFAKGIQD